MAEKVELIKKRDGTQVPFDGKKIRDVIQKAFLANNISNETIFSTLSQGVVNIVDAKYTKENLPSVEDIQDIVELVLISHGYMDIARAYMSHRAKHRLLRERETLQKIQESTLTVLRQDGEEETFTPIRIRKKLEKAAESLTKISVDGLMDEICKTVYNRIKVEEIDDLVLNVVKSRIEEHYNYSYLCSRLVLNRIYRLILNVPMHADNLTALYQYKFEDYLDKGIDLGLINSNLRDEFDLKKISAAIDPERDKEFMFLGMQTLEDRYLLRTRKKPQKVFELPQWLWMRVAMGLSLKEENKEDCAIEFYHVLSNFYGLNSTPTLFNSGTTHSQMSSCYLNTVDDSLTGIFKNYADCAQLSKWAGGIGTDWSYIRSKGAKIRGTNGSSQGVIPFIKIYNDTALAVNQGGKRKGAMATYLEVWHGDLYEYLDLRKNTGDDRRRAHDIHPALFVCDLFLKRVQQHGTWTLFSTDKVKDLHDLYGQEFEERYEWYEQQDIDGAKTVDALTLWKKILTMLYETGHPWITYKDTINVRSPQDHVGVIHCSNLCTEITLNTSNDETAVCNLASLNLSRMVKDRQLNEALIKKTVSTMMRMLDNVVDNNYYPIPEAENSNMRHRPVGLGVMGYQDALYQMNIDFDSAENLDFADKAQEMVSYYAILASSKLAKEKGKYASYKGSKWDRGIFPLDTLDLLEQERGQKVKVNRKVGMDWSPVKEHVREYGMRNSNTMAIAPTATIANITGVVPCVEPIYKNIYMKENLSGNFIVINRYLVDALESRGMWTKNILNQIKFNNGSVANVEAIPVQIRKRFKEVFEIDPTWVLQAAARRSKWIDQAASTNIFMNTTSGKQVSEVYMLAWELGIKTTYYLRTLAATQVSKTVQMESTAQAIQPTLQADKAEIEVPAALPPDQQKLVMRVPEPTIQVGTGFDYEECEACQ